MTGLRANDVAPAHHPSFLIYRIFHSSFHFPLLFFCLYFFSPWINVCSGLDLTKYLAYLSLCTTSSLSPFFHFHLLIPTSTPVRAVLLATLISFELVRAPRLHSPLHQCHVMKFYISIPFFPQLQYYCIPGATTAPVNLSYHNVHQKGHDTNSFPFFQFIYLRI
jgi:hypothetical protein